MDRTIFGFFGIQVGQVLRIRETLLHHPVIRVHSNEVIIVVGNQMQIIYNGIGKQ